MFYLFIKNATIINYKITSMSFLPKIRTFERSFRDNLKLSFIVHLFEKYFKQNNHNDF